MTPADQTAVIGHPPEQRGYEGPGVGVLIHDTARIEAFVSVDSGTSYKTTVGPRSWLMKHVHVGHDAQIGADCELAPGTVVGGWATVRDGAKIGMNATILPFRNVGPGARVGAGSVVTQNVPAGETWAGNPARKLEDSTRDPRPFTDRDQNFDAVPPEGFTDRIRDEWERLFSARYTR